MCPSLASLQYLTEKPRSFKGGVGVVFNDDSDGYPLNISGQRVNRNRETIRHCPTPHQRDITCGLHPAL